MTTYTGTTGNDTLYGSKFDDILNGGAGNDTLYAGKGNDTLEGGTGDDTLEGGTGDDTLNGEDGTDTVSYVSASGAVTVNLIAGTASGADGNDTLISIENVYGSNNADTLTGDANSNYLSGYGGNDFLYGGKGNDTLTGGTGDDTLNGGDGTDWVYYANASGAVTVNLAAGTASGADGNDTLISIENVLGSNNADTLTGDANSNYLSGYGGNDFLYGGKGNDTLSGGAGDDTLNGEDGTDSVSYSNSVTVNLATGTATGADGNDTLISIENVYGSKSADTLTGDAGNNALYGGKGNDTLMGGAGDDTLNGEDGTDTVYYSGGAVTVNLAAGTATGADGNDTLISIENVSLYQSKGVGGSSLTGNTGNNALYAGKGNDTLYGGKGNDTLTGNAGSDTFKVWDSSGDTSTDTIIDFTAGIGGDSLTIPTGQFTNFNAGTNPFTTGHARLTQSGANTLLELDKDGAGSGAFQTAMILNNVTKTNLVASNLNGFSPTASVTTTLVINIIDTGAAAQPSTASTPLLNNPYDTFKLGINGVLTTIALGQTTAAAADTYASLLAAFQTATNGTGITASLGGNFTVTDPLSGLNVTGQSILLTMLASNGAVLTAPTGSGWYNTSGAAVPATSNIYTTYTTTATTLPTYSLAANATSYNEGTSATFTLTTSGVANGTVLPYALSGTINASDVTGGILSGNVTVNNNTATITVGLLADAMTEGSETLTASVTGTTASASTSIADTSTGTTPPNSAFTKSKIYMGSGGDSFAIVSSGATLYGNTGTDAITIASGINGVKTDANIERIGLTGNLADYKFGVVVGTGIQIQTTAGVVIGTLPSLNQTTTLVFADGSAPLMQTGGSAFSLAGLAISTTTSATVAATLNTADKFSALASSTLTHAKIYMGSGGDSFAITSSGATLYGNTGTDTITIASSITGVKTDANVERIELAQNLSGYKFGVVAGTGIQIQTSAGVVVATLPSLNQTTTLAFADGSAPLVQTGGSAFSLGGLAISTTTAAAIAASLNTADKSSVAVTTGPVAVTISGAGTSTDGGAAVATTYSIGAGTYTHTINGFGAGDILKLFSGAALTVMPDSNDTDGIQSLSLADAATGATTTITLTGLASAQDAGLFNLGSFNTVFGAGTIV